MQGFDKFKEWMTPRPFPASYPTTWTKAVGECGHDFPLALHLTSEARDRASDEQALSSGITRVARSMEFANRSSTARAALAAEPPVPHGDPDGVGDVRIAREAPMQDQPKRIANGTHSEGARLEHQRLRARGTTTHTDDAVTHLLKERRVSL